MTDGAGESPAAPPQPAKASTPAEFVSALRALRTWSGLTYRQLEGKAESYRDALPASTIATTLGRATLPKERFVDAFTRACGLGEDEVRLWLDTRKRIAMSDPSQPDDDPPPEPASRWRRLVPLLAAAVVGIAFGVATTLGVGGESTSAPPTVTVTPTPLPGMPIAGLDMRAVGSWANIHPAGSPDLCVTDGVDRTGRYNSAVAAQMPCTQPLPHVYLEPLAQNVVQIQWHHPGHGIGCLTLMTDGEGKDMFEPQNVCDDDKPTQQFRLEMARGRFRVHVEATGRCLGLRAPIAEGAEAVQVPCSDAPDQWFTIELVPPPA